MNLRNLANHPIIVIVGFLAALAGIASLFVGLAQLQVGIVQLQTSLPKPVDPTPAPSPAPTTSPSTGPTPPSPTPSNKTLISPEPNRLIDPKPPVLEPPKTSNYILEGKWIVEERATSKLENWKVITWDYDLKRSNNTLKLEGRKIRVDGIEPTWGERLAVSILELEYDGSYQAKGRFKETNHKGKVLQGTIELDFAADLQSFSGFARAHSANTSSITGSKQ